MRASLACAALSLTLAGCGTTKVVTKTVPAPPAVNPAADHEAVRSARRGGTPGGCGVERWAVKTLTDPGAGSVDLTPKPSTVAALGALPVPPGANTPTRLKQEQATYTVSGTLTLAKREADHDFHLVIATPGQTMIAEIPDPACAAGSRVLPQLQKVHSAFVARYGDPARGVLRPNAKVTVTGVLFYDRIHGQTGVSPTGVELHPLLAGPS